MRSAHAADGWPEFVVHFDREIAPLYLGHERDFDAPGIHGRMHAARCTLFAEFMARDYRERGRQRPSMDAVRFAAAMHDAGRRANGPDLWEHDSITLADAQAARHPDRFRPPAPSPGSVLQGKSDPLAGSVESRIVHDADVLEIMRPCCGHGGREGFREGALVFRCERDPAGSDAELRAALIEEAWSFIRATEERKEALRGSDHYLADLLGVLSEQRARHPRLAQALVDAGSGK